MAAEGSGEGGGEGRRRAVQMRGEGGGDVAGAGVAIAAEEGIGGEVGREAAVLGEEIEDGVDEVGERYAVFARKAGGHPVGEGEEGGEGRRSVFPDQGGGGKKAVGADDGVPVVGEAGGAQEVLGGPVAGGEDFVGGRGTIAHGVGVVVAGDGRPGEFFQDAELDFVGVEGDEAVEAGCKTFGSFAGESGDEVGVEEGVGVGAEEAEVVGGAVEILRAADGVEDGGGEGLEADFELKGAGREARKDVT